MNKLIRFKFDANKFINALTYFAETASNLTKLKAAKLLYLADREHLGQYGRPIIGDVYYRMDKGPVPSKALDIINDMVMPERALSGIPQTNTELFKKYLSIDFSSRHPVLKKKRDIDWDVFSESEITTLKDIAKLYAKRSNSYLIELTHEHEAWTKTPSNCDIDYRSFLDHLSDEKKMEMCALLEIEQEDREIFDL